MEKRFTLSLKQMWVLISVFSLILPILMPSSSKPQNFLENVIGTVTVTMFFLSFPCSLLGLPFMLCGMALLGINPNSIEGLYFNLFLFFVFGFVQWFWIVPRFLENKSGFQMLNLRGGKSEIQFSEAHFSANNEPAWDAEGRTRLEKVILERDSG